MVVLKYGGIVIALGVVMSVRFVWIIYSGRLLSWEKNPNELHN